MFKLDFALLKELGLGDLDASTMNQILATMYEQLEMRVGMTLAAQMSNQQLDEFEGFIDRSDEKGALSWLESNFPTYKLVVADKFSDLKSEMVDNRIEIRSILIDSAPSQLCAFLVDALGSVEPAFARDLFVLVGDVDAVCNAEAEVLRSVPSITTAMIRRIRKRCECVETSARKAPPGIPDAQIELLMKQFRSWRQVEAASDDQLLQVHGVGRATLRKIRQARPSGAQN